MAAWRGKRPAGSHTGRSLAKRVLFSSVDVRPYRPYVASSAEWQRHRRYRIVILLHRPGGCLIPQSAAVAATRAGLCICRLFLCVCYLDRHGGGRTFGGATKRTSFARCRSWCDGAELGGSRITG